MIRDPWWIFAYWEIRPDDEQRVCRQIGAQRWDHGQSILRVYDVTDGGGEDVTGRPSFDIVLRDLANNWYINVGQPNRAWCVELGRLAADGAFAPLVRSNRVTTPRAAPSDVIDEHWMLPDEAFWKLFGVAGARTRGTSSWGVSSSDLYPVRAVRSRLSRSHTQRALRRVTRLPTRS